MKATRGLTFVEVLIALAVLSVVMVALNTLLVSSLRETSLAGSRTQAVQILNYIGRRVVGGETALLPKGKHTYDYGTLSQTFPDLPKEVRIANPDLYKAVISNEGPPSWAQDMGVAVNTYRIQVCWRRGEEEHCTEARTFASPPSPSGQDAPLLPGIN